MKTALGFLGVACGFAWNGVLQRSADKRKLADDRTRNDEKTTHETRILRTGLLAELKSVVNTYEGELDHVMSHDFTWVPVVEFFAIYKENLDKLGYLTPDEIEAVTKAYYTFQERIGYIARNGVEDSPNSNSVIGRHIRYPLDDPSRKQWLCDDLDWIIKTAKEARDKIDDKLGSRDQFTDEGTHISPAPNH